MFELTVRLTEEETYDFTTYHRYQELLPDEEGELTIANKVSRNDFAAQVVANFLNSSIHAKRVDTAMEIAKNISPVTVDISNK